MRSILVLNLIIKKIFYDIYDLKIFYDLPRGQNINIEILKIFARNAYERIRCYIIWI